MKKGYSLIEMAIVLVIISVITATVFKLLPRAEIVRSDQLTVSKMDEIEKALMSYVSANGVLPCPADITVTPNAATFATAGTNCNTTIAGDITITPFSLRIGMIPVRTLGLPDDYAFDAWGNRIRYAVVKELTLNPTSFLNFASEFLNMSPEDRTFNIVDGAGSAVTPSNTFTTFNHSIAYIILSHGANGNGAVPYGGGTPPPCPASGLLDQENCNGDRSFRDAFFSTGTSNYFDDHVRRKTYNQVRSYSKIAAAANSQPLVIISDQAHLQGSVDCGPSSLCTTIPLHTLGTSAPGGYGNGLWVRRFHTLVNNFSTEPLTVGGALLTLPPGKYTFVARSYYWSNIATTLTCRITNITTGIAIGSSSIDLPAAQTEGNLTVLSSYNTSANNQFVFECAYSNYSSAGTRFNKPGSNISVYQMTITRH